MKTVHKKPRAKAENPSALPSRETIKAFLKEASQTVGLREVARAFGVAPDDKKALRGLMKSLEADGVVERAGRRKFVEAGRLPETAVVEVTGIDRDGEALARPVAWDGPGRPPVIFMHAEARGQAALAPGARVLARLKQIGGDKYEGRTLKRLAEQVGGIVGVFHPTPQGGRIEPTDRRQKSEWVVPQGETLGALADEIVRAEPLPGAKFLGPKPARITERLGSITDARSVSLIAIATHGIPMDFPGAAVKEAEKAKAAPLSKRTDLREVPLITIDGADARDFDDAVFAEPASHGYRLIVAIADVAHYVKPGSALDKSAKERGNSCYFPDRVVPMLPEALSNGWCSLKPHEERGCLFVEMHIDVHGAKLSHQFGRGLMRSAARKTYEQVQAEFEDDPNNHAHLYAAFTALKAAREARGTLDLDLPERKVVLGADGQVQSIAPRPRLDSHRLIEEFMILANVCAAEELEKRRLPCMYRVHAPPSAEKLDNLRSFLATLDISLAAGDQIHPRDLDRVLKLVAGTDKSSLVNETILRSQSQAEYSPGNVGHFGLALTKYAHFTSPIRRYADLLVHRALITGLKLGRDGLAPDDISQFEDTAERITATERRAALAERDSTDRYLALYLQHRVGELFTARVSGVTKFGLFVTLPESGASGFLSMASLADDFWMHDEAAQSLIGKRSRKTYQLAQMLDVRLTEARPVTGGLLFAPADAAPPRGPRSEPRGRGTHKSKPKSKRRR
ncbi:ribonuclease R [Acidocella sp.]|uniref:ribonuclease R n=1 Tax=Acidocella sp. TaxID=50710 RepID=UPI0017D51CA2|nr:ribonuclease R [Acidocella sp.]